MNKLDLDQFESSPDEDSMKQLMSLCNTSINLEENIADIENHLKELKKQKDKIDVESIPLLLSTLGIDRIKLENGRIVEKAVYYSPKIIDESKFFKYLNDNNINVIKTAISLSFGMGEEDAAESLRQRLEDEGYSFNSSKGVHAQTLKRVIKELDESGELQFLEDSRLVKSGKFTRAKIK